MGLGGVGRNADTNFERVFCNKANRECCVFILAVWGKTEPFGKTVKIRF